MLALVLVGGCDGLAQEETPTGDLVERLQRQAIFGSLTRALGQTGLEPLLRSDQAYTVLAPTEIAFDYAGEDFVASLMEFSNREVLGRVLRTHIIEGRLAPEDFVDGTTLRTIGGQELLVRRLGPAVRVGGMRVDLRDPTEAEGSVAYPLADVMLKALTVRERVELSPSLSLFAEYARRDGILDRLDALPSATLLAATNPTIEDLGGLSGLLFGSFRNVDIRQRALDLHLIAGTPELVDGQPLASIGGDPLVVEVQDEVRRVGGRRVHREEVLADGRLLILETVILEPLSLAQRLRIEPAAATYWEEIRDTLPNIWARLQDETEDLTLFVPTLQAYRNRGEAINTALTDPTNAALNLRLLKTHILEGRLAPEALTNERELMTLDGTVVTVDRNPARISVDGRTLQASRRASNGMFYTTDGFILPAVDAFDTALLRGYTSHVAAVRRAGLESVFRSPGLTAFLATNAMYASDQRLVTNPRPFLRFNATEASYRFLQQTSFGALDGSVRSILKIDCPPGAERCSDYQFEDEVQIFERAQSTDGTGYLHELLEPSYPPDF